MAKAGYVYIMANRKRATLYIGVTSYLVRRVYQHREHHVPGFTRRYGCTQLVYFETFDEIADAIVREKALKKWNRAWKIDLIELRNPEWCDLWDDIIDA